MAGVKTVIYSKDLEPLTVLEFPTEYYEIITKGGLVRYEILKPLCPRAIFSTSTYVNIDDREIIQFYGLPINARHIRDWLVITPNVDLIAKLESVLLQGQEGDYYKLPK